MVRAPETLDNLWIAAGDGQLDRVKELVESGVSVNIHDQHGYTPMHAAVSYNQTAIVEYLLEKGANVNIEDFEKDTPLYVAESVDMAQLLIERGADPNHKNEEDLTPALNAHQEGWRDVAEFLASVTNETLPSIDDEVERAIDSDGAANDIQDDADMERYVEEMIRRIQEQGGVEDEEELRGVVTKMILDQLQRNNE
ncbi:ankyrin repeat-containing domain protein [Dichotomocladium elegans]|nr:ankyrin repeat-containing domain protein [Dichotomocladium elegans]